MRYFILSLILLSAAGAAIANSMYFNAILDNNITLLNKAIRQYPKAIDETDSYGETPLSLAIDLNRDEIAKILVKFGANINAVPLDGGSTPWLQAGSAGKTDLLKEMIKKKPDLTLVNSVGGNALIPACDKGHLDAVRVLVTVPGLNLDQVNNFGWTCILEAIILGDGSQKYQDIISTVLKAGASPTLADKNGVTPLEHAKRLKQTQVVKIITSYMK